MTIRTLPTSEELDLALATAARRLPPLPVGYQPNIANIALALATAIAVRLPDHHAQLNIAFNDVMRWRGMPDTPDHPSGVGLLPPTLAPDACDCPAYGTISWCEHRIVHALWRGILLAYLDRSDAYRPLPAGQPLTPRNV
jgi:hypothetical protein